MSSRSVSSLLQEAFALRSTPPESFRLATEEPNEPDNLKESRAAMRAQLGFDPLDISSAQLSPVCSLSICPTTELTYKNKLRAVELRIGENFLRIFPRRIRGEKVFNPETPGFAFLWRTKTDSFGSGEPTKSPVKLALAKHFANFANAVPLRDDEKSALIGVIERLETIQNDRAYKPS